MSGSDTILDSGNPIELPGTATPEVMKDRLLLVAVGDSFTLTTLIDTSIVRLECLLNAPEHDPGDIRESPWPLLVENADRDCGKHSETDKTCNGCCS